MVELNFEDLRPPDRYERLRSIDWWDQEKLRTARVLVAGAGALGNEVIKNLALLGIGHITIVDFDRIEYSNLTRSVLFREGDIGAWKAEVAALRAHDINPEVDASWIVGDLELDIGLGFLKTFQIVLGCLDSVNARWALNKACRKAGVPWINGGMNATAGEVSFFSPTHNVCYECTMTDDMWQRFDQRYSCTKLAKALPPASIPTTATVASVTAGIQVQQALVHLHSLNEGSGIAPGAKVFISLKPLHFFTVALSEDPECLAHEIFTEPVLIAESPRNFTAANLFSALEEKGIRPVTLELDYDLITALACINCGESAKLLPVKKVKPTDGPCPQCGTLRRPILLNEISTNNSLMNELLSSLGVPSRAILRIKTENQPIHVEFSQ